MYVAGFERGVRPIGFWSISITLSNTSIPSTPACAPGLTRARLSRFASALKTISFTSVDLPEPETPVTQMNLPTGNSTSMSLRLCCAAPRTRNEPRSSSRRCRNRDRPFAREELARDRLGRPLDLPRRALGDDLAAVQARAGPHVDEPVGAAHHLLVVLDDDDGVADVAEPLERVDQARVVALVQADRRLVEDVEDADELRADLRREPHPLRLAARQRRRRAVEREVADPDVVEEGEPLADLLHDPVPDQLFSGRQREPIEERERPRHRHLRELVDRALADRDREHLGLEARALADRARAQ